MTYTNGMWGMQGGYELSAELAKPHHTGPGFRVCSGKNDERKQEECASCIIEAIERDSPDVGEFRQLEVKATTAMRSHTQ
jgi:hypothetical protein